MYFEGKGVPQDYVTAYMWLNLAAARSPAGDTHAAKARDLVAGRLTRAQIAEGQKLARQWCRNNRQRTGQHLSTGPCYV
jgi:uncharacterized protein